MLSAHFVIEKRMWNLVSIIKKNRKKIINTEAVIAFGNIYVSGDIIPNLYK